MRSHRDAIKCGATFVLHLLLMAAVIIEAAPAETTTASLPATRQHQAWEMVWLRASLNSGMGGGRLEMAARRDAKLADELGRRLGEVVGVALHEPMGQEHELHLYRLQEIDLESTAGQLELQPNEQLFLTNEDLMNHSL